MTQRTHLPDATDLDDLRRRLEQDGAAGGQRQPIGLGRVRIGSDALASLVDDVASVRRDGPVVVVVDETPIRRGDADLKALVVAALEAAGPTRLAVIRAHGQELHADADALLQADGAIAGAGCVVSVGSGTITDIAKDASLRAGRIPFVVVQTAVSVNAFSDDMAVLLRDGVKRTVPSRWPDVLIVDLEVLAAAPAPMNRAGFGELCSMFTAPADWYLAGATGMDDSFDAGVVELFRDGAEGLLNDAARVADNDPGILAEMAGRMTLTGIAMGVAGRTAPLSGTEHLLSHLLDMAAGLAGRPLAFHGAQVGVASVLAATIWADTLEHLDPDRLTGADAFPDKDVVQARVREAFDPLDPSGRMAGECWRDVGAQAGPLARGTLERGGDGRRLGPPPRGDRRARGRTRDPGDRARTGRRRRTHRSAGSAGAARRRPLGRARPAADARSLHGGRSPVLRRRLDRRRRRRLIERSGILGSAS